MDCRCHSGRGRTFSVCAWPATRSYCPTPSRSPTSSCHSRVTSGSACRWPLSWPSGIRTLVVLLTQPDVVSARNCHECGTRVERLVTLGVASSRIRVLQLTRGGTLGEAEACRTFILRGSLRGQLLVVSSPYHTRRAFAVFRHVLAGTGVEVGVAPATRFSDARPEFWWAAPYDRWYVTYEWAATVYSRFVTGSCR